MSDIEQLLSRAESLFQRVEQILPSSPPAPDWGVAVAFDETAEAAGRPVD